ncbi:30S ribosomal protein S11 [Candidatus Similichlamydia laticola]|uniref:Small ribosomal subunit protein uS11 n=1 Tax=Candidatus Similichlamydia laticola TaxID=2170265 RepID=A0A369KBV7_9BACT|nr:SSU ribosomal protein S11p (S14e) [Candidatus Similichlamydia laticola]
MSKQDSGSSNKPGNKKGVLRTKRRQQRNVPSGVAYVLATFNNTLVTITDPAGNVLSWASAGRVNFKGSRKSSACAASVAAQSAGKSAMSMGMKEIEVNLRGAGGGREAAVRGLQSVGLVLTLIKDRTRVPHNGCRPRKRRRV